MKYRYGVFPEIGFPGDARYPEVYEVGPEVKKNEGCNTTLGANSTEPVILRQMVRSFSINLISIYSKSKIFHWQM